MDTAYNEPTDAGEDVIAHSRNALPPCTGDSQPVVRVVTWSLRPHPGLLPERQRFRISFERTGQGDHCSWEVLPAETAR